MAAAGLDFPLIHASAEATGLSGRSFDIVFCDFGAMTFADPRLTVPEAARLLRPGGLFAFSALTPIADLAWPARPSTPAVSSRWATGSSSGSSRPASRSTFS